MESVLNIGFARMDITPPLGVPIGGYFKKRITKGVLDPIFARAISFCSEGKSALLLSLDMWLLNNESANEWPKRIANVLGLDPDSVFLCCTHSHTTPKVTDPESDKDYDRWLFERLCEAGRRALEDEKEVIDIRAAQQDQTDLTFSRRFRMKDGAQMGNPPAATWEDVSKIAHPLGNVDQSLRFVRILRKDAPEILIVNFQSHPDCIGGELISADFPGAVCSHLEEAVDHACAVFLNGAQGNMVINNRMQPLPSCGIKNYDYAIAHGKKIADVALSLYNKAESVMKGKLQFSQVKVHAKTKRNTLPLDYCKDIVERYAAGGLEAIDPNPKIATPIVAEARQVWQLEQEQLDYLDLPVTVLTAGGFAVVGIPGEPFSEVGRSIRDASPYPMTCVCCLTNGSFGYFANKAAIEEGGYDTINTKLVKGTTEALAESAISQLQALKNME